MAEDRQVASGESSAEKLGGWPYCGQLNTHPIFWVNSDGELMSSEGKQAAALQWILSDLLKRRGNGD